MTNLAPPRASIALTFLTRLNALWLRRKKQVVRRKPKVPRDLSDAQMKDAGIAWELAGYGRGADVSKLAITIAQSQR